MEKLQLISSDNYQQTMNEEVLPYLRAHVRAGREENGLYYEFYPLDEFRGTVMLSHGFTENCAKFAEIIYYLHRAGYQVATMDHRGHGRSQREKGLEDLVHIDRFETYVEDMHRMVRLMVLPDAKEKPTCLIGHSMGGAISLMYLEAHPEVFTRGILTAPMVQVNSAPFSFRAGKGLADGACLLGKTRKRAFVTSPYSHDETLEKSCCCGQARFDWYHDLCEKEPLFQQGAATTAARKQLLLEQRRQIVSRIDELNSALNRLDWKLDSYEERMLKCEENLVNFSESSKPVESIKN